MTKFPLAKFSLLVIPFAMLACSLSVQTASRPHYNKDETYTTRKAAPTPPLTQITISREQVNLRNSAGVVEVAIQGDTFAGACDGTWCYIGNGRRVWQACTNQRYWADYEVCR